MYTYIYIAVLLLVAVLYYTTYMYFVFYTVLTVLSDWLACVVAKKSNVYYNIFMFYQSKGREKIGHTHTLTRA